MSHILLVEDSKTETLAIRGILEKAGMSVQCSENGRAALDSIEYSLPDVVLTDMHMPEIDGLQLIERIREQHLFLPVVLMTQFGSEELAVKALKNGAAGYVPKQNLHRVLIEMLDEVLEAAMTRRHQDGLSKCLQKTSLQFVLPNDPDLISPLVGRVQQELLEMHLGDEMDVIRMGVALREALMNAMQHGNLEVSSDLRQEDDAPYYHMIEQRLSKFPYCDRRVFVETTHSSDEAVFVVRDEGPGFDPRLVPDPTADHNLQKPSGRGLLLIRTFMDDMRHNPAGNQITMVKRREPTAKQVLPSAWRAPYAAN